jgi:hypothetical protein
MRTDGTMQRVVVCGILMHYDSPHSSYDRSTARLTSEIFNSGRSSHNNCYKFTDRGRKDGLVDSARHGVLTQVRRTHMQ